MKAHQLRGLKNIFDQSAWSTHDLGVENCRGVCYSDLNCQYWQYFTGTGCWVETVDHMMPYPLSFADDSVRTYDDNSGASGDLKDGEFIQHYCTVTTTTTINGYWYDWSTADHNNYTNGQRVWLPQDTPVCVLSSVAIERRLYKIDRNNRKLTCDGDESNAVLETGKWGAVTEKTKDGLYKVKLEDDAENRTVIARSEDVYGTQPTVGTGNEKVVTNGDENNWNGVLMGAALLLLAGCCLCAYCLMTRGDGERTDKKKKKKRALKKEEDAPVEAPPVSAAPPPVETQSVALQSAPQAVTYQAAPVVAYQAAPSAVATYAAPVTHVTAPTTTTGAYVVGQQHVTATPQYASASVAPYNLATTPVHTVAPASTVLQPAMPVHTVAPASTVLQPPQLLQHAVEPVVTHT